MNRGLEIDGRRFYDRAEEYLKRFRAESGCLPYDWIEVAETYPDVYEAERWGPVPPIARPDRIDRWRRRPVTWTERSQRRQYCLKHKWSPLRGLGAIRGPSLLESRGKRPRSVAGALFHDGQ